MGGGGQVDTTVSSNANTALYTTFAIGGLIAGGLVNVIGPKMALAIGGTGYVLYSGSLLAYNHDANRPFVIVAGGLLGCCAALLWTGQGAIMLSYPLESNKGTYISIFWAIFNLGGVIGSIIPLALNWNSPSGTVNDGTYIGFMIAMACGVLVALLLLPPSKVYHDDGSPVALQRYPDWKEETIGVLKLFTDWRMLCLTPMFLASNWYYAYQFDAVNAFYFNIRTRAFNNLWYWFAQIVGALLFGKLLDLATLNRRTRGFYGFVVLSVIITATWICGLFFQLSFKRYPALAESEKMDLFDKGYGSKLTLYLAYGLSDAMFQCYAYWLMGALTNETALLSRYTGFYKGVQSAGGAISWRIDAVNTNFLAEMIISWAMITIAFPGMLYVVLRIKDTNYVADRSPKEEKAVTVAEKQTA
ncbi:2482_t:CDS:2 [Paraglomus brasilianum]|uniref:2482_t:CDS:1 n=1 Tax=Paraglomus brasilianum TaxID=144538 RepID=A0A9N9CK08_9GLOM|nr:2482_t:CDS:2 [Paraglomus brasilianum]